MLHLETVLCLRYVGEVLTDEMLDERMATHARTHPNDVNMYVMELESGLYLDARQKGNVSRFINHSCEGNCELQKWIVSGVTRIGIFAMVDIPAGTALSYDYSFSTNEHGRFRCKCGSARCRGSLSAQGFVDDSAGKVHEMVHSMARPCLPSARTPATEPTTQFIPFY